MRCETSIHHAAKLASEVFRNLVSPEIDFLSWADSEAPRDAESVVLQMQSAAQFRSRPGPDAIQRFLHPVR